MSCPIQAPLMPRLNSTNGRMQQVEAARAPIIPPVAMSRALRVSAFVNANPSSLGAICGLICLVSAFIPPIIGPVVTTDARKKYETDYK